MARSFKKYNAGGNCASSEKKYKTQSHRKSRKKLKQSNVNKHDFMFEDKLYGNPWHGPKDGKTYNLKTHPNFLRK